MTKKKVVIKPMDYSDKAWTISTGGVVYPGRQAEEKAQPKKSKK
jgi:hypothetical protein